NTHAERATRPCEIVRTRRLRSMRRMSLGASLAVLACLAVPVFTLAAGAGPVTVIAEFEPGSGSLQASAVALVGIVGEGRGGPGGEPAEGRPEVYVRWWRDRASWFPTWELQLA